MHVNSATSSQVVYEVQRPEQKTRILSFSCHKEPTGTANHIPAENRSHNPRTQCRQQPDKELHNASQTKCTDTYGLEYNPRKATDNVVS